MKKKLSVVALFLAIVMALGLTMVVNAQPGDNTMSMEIENALVEEFGTTDPLEIGEEAYTYFLTNFLERRSAEAREIQARFGGIYINAFEGSSVAARSIVPSDSGSTMNCPFCSRVARSTVTFSNWGFTGASRLSGTFPNQFVENEQSRTRSEEMIGPCGRLIFRTHTTQTRWVRA